MKTEFLTEQVSVAAKLYTFTGKMLGSDRARKLAVLAEVFCGFP
jgi:hypothetical protein